MSGAETDSRIQRLSAVLAAVPCFDEDAVRGLKRAVALYAERAAAAALPEVIAFSSSLIMVVEELGIRDRVALELGSAAAISARLKQAFRRVTSLIEKDCAWNAVPVPRRAGCRIRASRRSTMPGSRRQPCGWGV